ncbi:hypothetical protein lerEdw1_015882 [Lerista edwardsae]|nr:hypothetical protein lerEdw1_015882 [Lerista edwardsae]
MQSFMMHAQVNVAVYQADPHSVLLLALHITTLEMMKKPTVGKVWIAVFLQDLSLRLFYKVAAIQHLHGSLSFSIQERQCTECHDFDSLLSAIHLFGGKAFHCFSSKSGLAVKGWTRCKEKEEREILARDVIDRVLSQDSSRIYNSIQAVAHALHVAFASLNRRVAAGAGRMGNEIVQPWQVLLFAHGYVH